MKKQVDLYKNFIDIESTSIDPHEAEVLTCYIGSFNGDELVSELDERMKVIKWSEDAEQIHKIPYAEMLTYQDKEQGLAKIYQYMIDHPGEYICHANWNNMCGKYLYDFKVLEMEAFRMDKLYEYRKQFILSKKYTFTSTHSIAKEKGVKGKLSLTALCDRFGYKYLAHEARSDVMATKFIYDQLMDMQLI